MGPGALAIRKCDPALQDGNGIFSEHQPGLLLGFPKHYYSCIPPCVAQHIAKIDTFFFPGALEIMNQLSNTVLRVLKERATALKPYLGLFGEPRGL